MLKKYLKMLWGVIVTTFSVLLFIATTSTLLHLCKTKHETDAAYQTGYMIGSLFTAGALYFISYSLFSYGRKTIKG
jgi:hypothetical protein